MGSTLFGAHSCSSVRTGGPLKRSLPEYEADGTQKYTDGDILFDTVYRFKGQQAPAVILVDGRQPAADDERLKRVMFCGMTRATVRLEVIMQVEDG